MSEKINTPLLAKKFKEYHTAIIDKEMAKAAEIYANYSEDGTFVAVVGLYHAMVDGWKEGQRIGCIEFLKEELYMTDYDIEEIPGETTCLSFLTIRGSSSALGGSETALRTRLGRAVRRLDHEIHAPVALAADLAAVRSDRVGLPVAVRADAP